jgi:hypothetical protein
MMPKEHRGSSCFLNPAVLGERETLLEEPMPENLITSVTREIDRLKKEIGQRASELAAVKDELIKHQRAYRLLAGRDTRAQRPARRRGRARRTTPVNWNSMLDQLPSHFTVGVLAKAAGARRKSSAYVRQVAVRWAKQGKTKRVGRGKYQKVQQGKSRAKAASQKNK